MSDEDSAELPAEVAPTGLLELLADLKGLLTPSMLKSLNRTIEILVVGGAQGLQRIGTSVVDLGLAHVDAASEARRVRTDAETQVMRAAADAAAKRLGEDPAVAERALSHLLVRGIREQKTREEVVQDAMEQLRLEAGSSESEAADGTPVDEDWLNQFARLVESRSAEDVKRQFSRVLAAEISSPGSFSITTLHRLSTLSPETARLFQVACSLALKTPFQKQVFIPWSPFGNPNENGLQDFGLNYMQLTRLRDAGLIDSDLNAWKQINPVLASLFQFGQQSSGLRPSTAPEEWKQPSPKLKLINFTDAGAELFPVVNCARRADFDDRTKDWLIQNAQVEAGVLTVRMNKNGEQQFSW